MAKSFYRLFLIIPFLQIGVKVEQLNGINNDVEFTQSLMSEKSVFVLPAKVSYNVNSEPKNPKVYEVRE